MKRIIAIAILILVLLAGCVTLLGKRKEGVNVRLIIKEADAGEWTSPGMPILTITEDEARENEIAVDVANLGFIRSGQTMLLSCYAYPNLIRKEKVRQIDPAVQKEIGASTIKVPIECRPNTPDLKFGQQVDTKIYTPVSPNTLILPFEALKLKSGKPFVALAMNEKISFEPVKTGIENTIHIEFLSGLKEGQEVLVPEGKDFKEGERIKNILRVTGK